MTGFIGLFSKKCGSFLNNAKNHICNHTICKHKKEQYKDVTAPDNINAMLKDTIEILSKIKKTGSNVLAAIEQKPALKGRDDILKNMISLDNNLNRVEKRLKIMQNITSHSDK